MKHAEESGRHPERHPDDFEKAPKLQIYEIAVASVVERLESSFALSGFQAVAFKRWLSGSVQATAN